MSTQINPQDTVGQIVKDRPDRSRVFEALGIDYCCGGKVSLTDACGKLGLNTQQVVTQLQQADVQSEQRQSQYIDADALSLTDLANHIEQTHHAYLRQELPRLDQITQKVASVHGDKDSRLFQVRQAFIALRDELNSHMMKEEVVLFPIIRQLEKADGPQQFHCGSVANPIRQMELEHDRAGNALEIMNKSSDGYQPPDWACNTYRAMLDGLSVLERDLHQHIHKENNVLFPKAIALESSLLSKVGA